MMKVCSKILRARQWDFCSLWEKLAVKWAKSTINQPNHVLYAEFAVKSYSRCYHVPLRRTNWYSTSFIPNAIRWLNSDSRRFKCFQMMELVNYICYYCILFIWLSFLNPYSCTAVDTTCLGVGGCDKWQKIVHFGANNTNKVKGFSGLHLKVLMMLNPLALEKLRQSFPFTTST